MAVHSAWSATWNYRTLLRQVVGSPDFERRCILLAVACARRVFDRITLPICREALFVAERAAGLFRVDPEAALRLLKEKYDFRLAMDFTEQVRRMDRRYQEAHEYQLAAGCTSWDRVAMWTVHPNTYCAFIMAADLVSVLLSQGNRQSVRAQKANVCEMVRDVFEPPLQAAQVVPRPAAAIDVAAEMDQSGDYSSMPALGELLAGAGCRDPIVLEHCTSAGRHVRGCWVVDQLLCDSDAEPKTAPDPAGM